MMHTIQVIPALRLGHLVRENQSRDSEEVQKSIGFHFTHDGTQHI